MVFARFLEDSRVKMLIAGATCSLVVAGFTPVLAMADTSAGSGIANCQITVQNYIVWTGKALSPKVTVTDGDKTLVAGQDYSVTYTDNVNPGVAKVTVTGLGSYASADASLTSRQFDCHVVKFQYKAKTKKWKSYVNLGKTAGKAKEDNKTAITSVMAKTDEGAIASNGISYSVRNAKKDWSSWASNGSKLELEPSAQCIRFQLLSGLAENFDVYYRVYIKNCGWMGWAKNGQTAGITGINSKLRIVAYQMKVVLKGAKAPGSTTMAYASSKEYESFSKYVLYNRIKNVRSKTKYMISVDTTLNRMAVYKGKKGHWKQIKYWKCGCGKASTPCHKGIFTLKGTTYRLDSGRVSYYYFKRYKQHLGFHSVTTWIGTKKLNKSLKRQIGLNVSHGCVRLAMDNAKWVSKLPRHTRVSVKGLV